MKQLFSLLLLVIFLGGCGLNSSKISEKAAEKVIENQTGSKVDLSNNGETMTVKSSDGSLTFGAKEIPSDFPSDVPVYPGSKPNGSYVATGKDNGLLVGLETSDDYAKVMSYYLSELKKNNWEVSTTVTDKNTLTYTIKKDDRAGVVSVQNQPEKKSVGITIVIGKQVNNGGGGQ